MMKYTLLLVALFLSLTVVTAAFAGKGGIPNHRSRPSVAATPAPPACESDLVAAAISGSAVDETLSRGSRTLVSSPIVVNIWDGTLSMTMDVVKVANRVEMPLLPEWVQFDPWAFCLEPIQGQAVEIWITVPQSAKRGVYYALLRALSCIDDACAGAAIEATITVE